MLKSQLNQLFKWKKNVLKFNLWVNSKWEKVQMKMENIVNVQQFHFKEEPMNLNGVILNYQIPKIGSI
jgi:hypothetical protein